MLYQKALTKREQLEKQINSITQKLKSLPDGTIYCTENGPYTKWYQSLGSTQTYIPKKNRHLAEQLAYRKYLSLLQKDLIREKNALDFYLRHHLPRPWKSELLLSNNPEYQKLLSPHFKPASQQLYEWSISSYEQNPNYPEQLIHKTASGKYVRSKSESFIDMILYQNKIPFRYECALHLDSTTIYPDFTIRHPKTGETYYWEHFGRMDDSNYAFNTFNKLELYTSHGIIPTIHLITTYETKDHPLSIEQIEKRVHEYFL